MIGETRLSHRLSRWTLLLLLALGIPLVCIPARAQEEPPAVPTTPAPSDAGAARTAADAAGEEAAEANEQGLIAGNKPDHLFLAAILGGRSPSDAESIRYAWVFDRDEGKRTSLRKGAAFRVGDLSATLEDIEEHAVLLRVDGRLRKWKLGMSFAALLNEKTEPRGLEEGEATDALAKEKRAGDDPTRSAVEIDVLDDLKMMILRGKEEDVERIVESLDRMLEQHQPKSAPTGKDDGEADQAQQAPQLEVYSLGELDHQTVLPVLQTLLAGRPEVRMKADPTAGNLIVLASPEDHNTIRAVLKRLLPKPAAAEPDRAQTGPDEEKRPEEGGDRPIPRVIYLRHEQAEQVAKVIREVYQGTPKELSVEIVPRLNAIVLVAPEALFWQVKELAEALDRAVVESKGRAGVILKRDPTRPQPTDVLRKPDPTRPRPTEAQPEDEPKLRFTFRHQKWSDVLEWYAEVAGLSLVVDDPIPGTFNYTDPREYTVAETMDLLNRVLLTKGYTLVRRDRMLLVVNVADGIPPDLVPRVMIEELGRRGKFELVSVIFPLSRRDAEEVRAGILPFLGAFGSAVVLPQTGQLLVTDRAGIIREISAIIESILEPEP